MGGHFSFMSERCPWADIPMKDSNKKFISCNAVHRECCKKNCAPLHFIENGVGKIIYDKLNVKDLHIDKRKSTLKGSAN